MKVPQKIKQDWKFASQEEVTREQLRINANLPFSKKLEWLEQAEQMIKFILDKKRII